MHSVPITTKVVSSNPTLGELYSIQLYVTWGKSAVSFTNKTSRHDITEILLKVTLNTITQKTSFPSSDDILVTCHLKLIPYRFYSDITINPTSHNVRCINFHKNIFTWTQDLIPSHNSLKSFTLPIFRRIFFQ
jgi:hypothetical protein